MIASFKSFSITAINEKVCGNFNKTNLKQCIIPTILLIAVLVFMVFAGLTKESYSENQRDLFYYYNHLMANHGRLMYEITQLGDALILFSLISIVIIYSPKLFSTLITASILSLILTVALKSFFSIPRPAATFDSNTFTIVGDLLKGKNSFPSGHSVTTFISVTLLMIGFKPKSSKNKFLWYVTFIIAGMFIVSSRVAVGAHYPIDVLVGAIIGYLITIISIVLTNKYNIWYWLINKRFYYLVLITSFLSIFFISLKAYKEHLIIYYISLLFLITTSYLIIKLHVKRENSFK